MIELRHDALEFSFPEVHPEARLSVSFQRTLRIPDDGREYPLPPGLGRFPLRPVDDHRERLPEGWLSHGGVLLPMYQAEALWLSFISPHGYPFALKVATGKIDAVSGASWQEGLHREPQDYLSIPEQPWLDGYCVGEGVIRQFVAMPLGAGYTAEEQLTGRAEHGGLQLAAYPLRAEVWERLRAERERRESFMFMDLMACCEPAPMAAMGLAPGGRMRQEIYEDAFEPADWDTAHSSRCFVHLAHSVAWREITGEAPPTLPPTAEAYTRAGLPWFDYYAEQPALPGSQALAGLKSVHALGKEKGEAPLPENASVEPAPVIVLAKQPAGYRVREGSF